MQQPYAQAAGPVPPIPAPFAGRRAAVIVAGTLLLGAGGVIGLMGLMVLLFSSAGQAHATAAEVLGSLATLAGLSAAAVVAGIGSILPRRWCRPVVVVATLITLVFCVYSLLGSLISMDSPKDDLMNSGMTPVGRIASAVTWAVFVIGPLVGLLLIYAPRTTEQMLVFYDPSPRWSDRVHIATLSMVAVSALMGVMSFGSGLWTRSLAVGPWIVEGTAATGVLMLASMIWFSVAALCIRKPTAARWALGAMLLLVFGLMTWSAFAGTDHEAVRRASESVSGGATVRIVGQTHKGPACLFLLIATATYLWMIRKHVQTPAAASLQHVTAQPARY
jgi:hypothetical protein